MNDKDPCNMRSKSHEELVRISLKTTLPQHKLALNELHRREIEEAENSSDERYRKIEQHLEDLKKPHWTVVPTFWFALIGALGSALAIFLWLKA